MYGGDFIIMKLPTLQDCDDILINCMHWNVSFLLLGTCPILTNPVYGMVTCSLGDDGAATAGDTCNYTCNDDNVRLSGDSMRTCGSDMMWSGNEAVCVAGKMNYTL